MLVFHKVNLNDAYRGLSKATYKDCTIYIHYYIEEDVGGGIVYSWTIERDGKDYIYGSRQGSYDKDKVEAEAIAALKDILGLKKL